MIFLLLLVVGVLFSGSSYAAESLYTSDTMQTQVPEMNIRLESLISADTLHLDDTLTFTVRVIIEGDATLYSIADFNPAVSNLRLVGAGSGTKSQSGGGVVLSIKEYSFKYVPVSMGMAYIEPVRVDYLFSPTGFKGTLTSSRLSITIVEPRKKPGKVPVYAWISAAGIIVLGLVIFFLVVRKRTEEEIVTEEVVPIEEKLLAELKEVIEKRGSIEKAQFFAALERIVRTYMLEKYSFDISGKSIKEITDKLFELEFSDSLTRGLERFLERSNLVRFGRQSADEEWIDDAILTVQKLLESKVATIDDQKEAL